MTTHIEHAVTEVIPEPELQAGTAEATPSWREQEKIITALSRHVQLDRRLRAEGFDD